MKTAEIYTNTHARAGGFCRAILAVFSATVLIPFTSFAEVLDLNTALQNTYRACVDIDENLHDIKVLAGINTGVTAVGTGLGIGATSVGIVKYATDKEAASYEKLLEELRELTKDVDYESLSDEEIAAFETEFNLSYDAAVKDIDKYQSELDRLTQKSKRQGNWRTGLLAGNTATNVAGAIIASRTINKDDIQGQVDACISATKDLNNAILSAKLAGTDVSEAQEIYKACREYEYVDISPINKRGRGAMISSSVGAGLGGVGTITSSIANSDKVRNDNTDSGKKKEKNLNIASNIMAGATTTASAAATVFNATQIAAIKKVAKVSENCAGVLK